MSSGLKWEGDDIMTDNKRAGLCMNDAKWKVLFEKRKEYALAEKRKSISIHSPE